MFKSFQDPSILAKRVRHSAQVDKSLGYGALVLAFSTTRFLGVACWLRIPEEFMLSMLSFAVVITHVQECALYVSLFAGNFFLDIVGTQRDSKTIVSRRECSHYWHFSFFGFHDAVSIPRDHQYRDYPVGIRNIAHHSSGSDSLYRTMHTKRRREGAACDRLIDFADEYCTKILDIVAVLDAWKALKTIKGAQLDGRVWQ